MTEPYFYDEFSSFQYDGSSSFQYTDNFQPLDTSFNGCQATGEPVWLCANEDINSSMSPLYDEVTIAFRQRHFQSPPSRQLFPQQAMNPVSTDPFDQTYGYPISFKHPQILPYHPQYLSQQSQVVDCSPGLDPTYVATPPSKRPIIALDWKSNDTIAPVKEGSRYTKNRKTRNIAPAVERLAQDGKDAISSTSQQALTARSLEDCMGLFDTTLTATEEKRRRKVFSAQEKKIVKSVRTIGACIQCKFRKKTCSAGRPCPYCTRLAGSTTLGTQLCQRDSPFIDRSMSRYYPSSSRKRILNFHLSTENLAGSQRRIFIDGAGPVTLALPIKILECNTETLELEDKIRILHTVEPEYRVLEDAQSLSEFIRVIKPGSLSSNDLETWAFDYTYKFAKTKNPHAIGFIFGVEYVRRGLPHSDIVNKITRLVSINFVLRAGITISHDSLSETTGITSPFRTIQAQVDTLLFESFEAAEKSLFRDLQRLVFRSAGSLARDAVVPVCFCVWQLARLQCMLASQLTNLAAYDLKRSRRSASPAHSQTQHLSGASPSSEGQPSSHLDPDPSAHPANTYRARQSEAEYLTHGLNLLLCTLEGLFRSACPLLLDWDDPFSKELLGNDEGLLELASKMGRTLRSYRAKGHSRKFKLGFGYDAEMSGRIRGLLRER